jgi:hypothetical protein
LILLHKPVKGFEIALFTAKDKAILFHFLLILPNQAIKSKLIPRGRIGIALIDRV